MNLAGTPACESMDEQGLHLQCNADVDHAPTDAAPNPAPHWRWSTILFLEMYTVHPGWT